MQGALRARPTREAKRHRKKILCLRMRSGGDGLLPFGMRSFGRASPMAFLGKRARDFFAIGGGLVPLPKWRRLSALLAVKPVPFRRATSHRLADSGRQILPTILSGPDHSHCPLRIASGRSSSHDCVGPKTQGLRPALRLYFNKLIVLKQTKGADGISPINAQHSWQ